MIRFPLETERLLIRPMRRDDAEELHLAYSDPEAMRFLAREVPRTVDETREWMRPKIAQDAPRERPRAAGTRAHRDDTRGLGRRLLARDGSSPAA